MKSRRRYANSRKRKTRRKTYKKGKMYRMTSRKKKRNRRRPVKRGSRKRERTRKLKKRGGMMSWFGEPEPESESDVGIQKYDGDSQDASTYKFKFVHSQECYDKHREPVTYTNNPNYRCYDVIYGYCEKPPPENNSKCGGEIIRLYYENTEAWIRECGRCGMGYPENSPLLKLVLLLF